MAGAIDRRLARTAHHRQAGCCSGNLPASHPCPTPGRFCHAKVLDRFNPVGIRHILPILLWPRRLPGDGKDRAISGSENNETDRCQIGQKQRTDARGDAAPVWAGLVFQSGRVIRTNRIAATDIGNFFKECTD